MRLVYECDHSSGCRERFDTLREFQRHWYEKHTSSNVTENIKTPENPQNACPTNNLETVGAGSVSRESPGAKGRDMSCVEKDKGEMK